MTDQATGSPSGAAPRGNAPATSNNTSGDTGAQSSFIRSRVAQMSAQTTQPAEGNEPGTADAGRQQQQSTPAGDRRMIEIDGNQYDEGDVRSAIAERAEAASRKATLPSSPDAYEIKLPDGFQAPEGVKFEFNQQDPTLKAARELAHKRGVSQEVFSEMLGVYASTQMGAAIQQSQLRDVNMRQLGTAGPQRVESVAVWLQARAGADGKAMANFLRQFPSAPIVRSMENLMRAFSNQGGADFSQSHRENAPETGKIAGYENMSFIQKRTAQMAQMLNKPGGYRGGGSRGER